MSVIMERPFIAAAYATFGIQFFGFIVSFWLKTEVYYDIFGSGNFLFLGLWTYLTGQKGQNTLSTITTALFLISRGWLLVFLAWRAHDRKGDARFDGVRDKFGIFLVFWMVQACWCWVVSFPMIYINTLSHLVKADATGALDNVLLLLFGLSIAIEIISDVQKAQWVAKGRPGGFCTIGFWKYSRHPNYFGEIMQWWCYFFLVVNNDAENSLQGMSCIMSPLFTSWILLFAGATGLTNAEGNGLKRYYHSNFAEEYIEYRQNTSILIPMIGYAKCPMWFKRFFLFEWERYEFQNKKES